VFTSSRGIVIAKLLVLTLLGLYLGIGLTQPATDEGSPNWVAVMVGPKSGNAVAPPNTEQRLTAIVTPGSGERGMLSDTTEKGHECNLDSAR
jgi:hypothetical protein